MSNKVSRKDVLAIIRKNVEPQMFNSFSDRRKEVQRVKWFGCRIPVAEVQKVLTAFGFDDVEVYSVRNHWVQSICIEFPHSNYK